MEDPKPRIVVDVSTSSAGSDSHLSPDDDDDADADDEQSVDEGTSDAVQAEPDVLEPPTCTSDALDQSEPSTPGPLPQDPVVSLSDVPASPRPTEHLKSILRKQGSSPSGLRARWNFEVVPEKAQDALESKPSSDTSDPITMSDSMATSAGAALVSVHRLRSCSVVTNDRCSGLAARSKETAPARIHASSTTTPTSSTFDQNCGNVMTASLTPRARASMSPRVHWSQSRIVALVPIHRW